MAEDKKESITLADGVVTQEATLIRLENKTQMAVAIQRPRVNEQILKEALEVLELSPVLVDAAIYCKPVGKDKETGKMQYAEGLSIRAAEELRRIYGNNSAGVSILEDRGDEVVIGAVFVDMEKNTRFAVQKVVSKLYKTHSGHIERIPPDRFADVVLPAHASKILREAILRCLPSWLKGEFEKKARELGSQGNLARMRLAMVEKFAELGVPQREILEFLGKPHIRAISKEDVITMRGIYNAIREGEQTVAEVFGGKSKEATPRPALPLQPGPVSPPAETAEESVPDRIARMKTLDAGAYSEACKKAGVIPVTLAALKRVEAEFEKIRGERNESSGMSNGVR